MKSLSQVEDLISDHMGGEWGEWYCALNDAPVILEGLGQVEVVDTEGNQEGGGEYSHIIFKVTYPEGVVRHYKMAGNYQSFNGCEWDGPFSEVTPENRTITVWVDPFSEVTSENRILRSRPITVRDVLAEQYEVECTLADALRYERGEEGGDPPVLQ